MQTVSEEGSAGAPPSFDGLAPEAVAVMEARTADPLLLMPPVALINPLFVINVFGDGLISMGADAIEADTRDSGASSASSAEGDGSERGCCNQTLSH
jgi:hypothetical protein